MCKSECLEDWWISHSPRNDNQNAEGTWEEWVSLASAILKADAEWRAQNETSSATCQMNPNATISPVTALPSEPQVRSSAWLGATDSQIIVAEIDEAAAAMAGCYEHLPASAKASAIKLGHALSNLRRRMVAPNSVTQRT